MKTLRMGFVLTAVLLLLALATMAVAAQGEGPFGPETPENVSSVTIAPNPALIGQSVTITAKYDFVYGGATVTVRDHVALCVYLRPASDMTSWRSAFPATVTGLATYTKLNSNACPDIPNYDDFYYVVTAGTAALSGGDTVAFTMNVPSIPAGTDKLIGFRLFTGTDCNGDAGNGSDVPSMTAGATNCSTFAGARASTFSVADPDVVRYVSDSSPDCGGNTPCDPTLQAAIDALPASYGTIRIYNTATSGPANIANKNILIEAGGGTPLLRCSTGGYLISVTGTGSLILDGVTVDGQSSCGTGFAVSATSTNSFRAENNARIQNFVTAGVAVTSTYAAMNNTTFSGNGIGVITYGGNTTIRGGAFTGNSGYAIRQNAGTVTAFANNITSNNTVGDGYQAYLSAPSSANVAKNWWGSSSVSAFGPRDASGSHAASWSKRLGADVVSASWGPSGGSVTLGNATLSPAVSGGNGTPVIIRFGNGLANAPFGNGVDPYASQLCSDFYDFYVVNGSGNWQVGLPVNTSPAGCVSVTLNQKAVYKIDPTKYDTNCATASDKSCWDLVLPASVTVDAANSRLLVAQTAAELAFTNFVGGDPTGADPTAIELSSLNVSSARTWLPWGLLALSLVLGGVGLYIARRKA